MSGFKKKKIMQYEVSGIKGLSGAVGKKNWVIS